MALLLAWLALYLLYGVELLFVHDYFGNRMNTVFKVYYQVWIVLAATGAVGLHYWRLRHRNLRGAARKASITAAGLASVLLLGALYYPLAAPASKAGGFANDPTLDGLVFLSAGSPAERRAIEWLAAEARLGETMVEAVGGSYSEFGRISSATGIPTVLGWPGHQHQWRGSTEPFEGREADVARIYQTLDAAEAAQLLARYGVSWVYIGQRERSAYLPLEIGKFDDLGERVFEEGNIVIFRLPREDGAVD